ncbi:MAG: hypothetical protein LBE36_06320 [Flavobacteriaceae bacterium]|jgi:hypothetical protein|nr:hypothetical protein [Flavobacteriaceae bacterium]
MTKQNSYLKIKNYFENIVHQSNFLNEFIGFFEREWTTKKASFAGIKSPVLALFRYELGFDSPNENALAVRKVAFAIMLKTEKPDDFSAQYSAIDVAEKLALKVLSRINFDSNTQDHFLWNSFLKDSVVINPVELSANDFGVEVFFNLKNKQLLKVNIEDWQDIDSVCQ